MTASTSSACTVLPAFLIISFMIPSAGAGTSSMTLSVSRSTIFSSRDTLSPAFLCQVETVASATDSGNSGTFTSIVIAISFSLMPEQPVRFALFRVQNDSQPLVRQKQVYPHNSIVAPCSTSDQYMPAWYAKHPGFVTLPDTKRNLSPDCKSLRSRDMTLLETDTAAQRAQWLYSLVSFHVVAPTIHNILCPHRR